MLGNKQSVEEILIETPVKTIIKTIYDMGLIDILENADEVLKKILFVERLRPDLGELNDDIH